jgi:hypothetical protein
MRRTHAAMVLVVLGGLLTSGCHEEPAEAAVRRVLDDGVAAIHARDVDRAARHLSRAYHDRFGNTATEIRQLAFALLRRGPLYVLLRDTKVEVDGATARVTATAYAVQGQPELRSLGDLVPRDADRLELTLTFALEDGRWRLRSVDGDGLDVPGFGG